MAKLKADDKPKKKRRGTVEIQFYCVCGRNIILRMITDDGKRIKKTCTIIDSDYISISRDEPQVVEVDYPYIDCGESFYCDYCGMEHLIGWLESKAW